MTMNVPSAASAYAALLPPGVAWIPGTALHDCRCHFRCSPGWIFKGEALERGLGLVGYVAHRECLAEAVQAAQRGLTS